MTRDEVLAEFDRRFEAEMKVEVDQLRRQGCGKRLINAFLAENRKRYAREREAAADKVLGFAATVH